MSLVEELREYEKAPVDQLASKGVDLEALTALLGQMQQQISSYAGLDVEERAPTVEGGAFQPGGWVGHYHLGEGSTRLRVSPSKLDESEFESLRKDVVGWLEFAGAPFVESFFEFYTSELLDKNTLYSSYSTFLIQLTESLVGLRPPRNIVVTDYVGPEVRGKLDWKATLQLQARDPTLYASKRVDFTFRTALNLMITKFHAELAAGLQEVQDKVSVQPMKEAVSMKREYHNAFLNSEPWRDAFDEAVRFDTFDPLNARRLDSEASRHRMQSMVDLWEAFQTRRSTWLTVGERFDAALKPMSKIYELWALKVLADTLSGYSGFRFEPPSEFPCTISFGGTAGPKLYYNRGSRGETVYGHGQVLREFSRKGIAPASLRPDFLITAQHGGAEEVALLGDAKYRRPEDLAGDTGAWERILAYIEEYTPSSLRARAKRTPLVILHVGEGWTDTYEAGGVKVFLVSLKPKSVEASKDYLRREVFPSVGI